MSQTIEWHREGLKNRKASLGRQRLILEKLQIEVDAQARSCNFLAAQINLAVKEGKSKFDAERYAINRLTR